MLSAIAKSNKQYEMETFLETHTHTRTFFACGKSNFVARQKLVAILRRLIEFCESN